MNRNSLAALAVALVVVSSGLGWVAASRIQSPQEVAATTAAPAASPILVPVEEKIISTDIVARGTARYGTPLQVTLPPSGLKLNQSSVTTLPLLNADLIEGDLLMTTSGRPVFVLTGSRPAYRDMGPGLSGEDIRQLEEGLQRLGFNPGKVDGRYDAKSQTAVAAWYLASGFEPMKATEAQVAAIRALDSGASASRIDVLAAKDRVVAATAGYVAAKEAQVAATRGSNTAAAVLRARAVAEADNIVATAKVASLQGELNDLLTMPNATPADALSAERALAAAQAAQTSTRLVGQQSVSAAQVENTQGPSGLAAAQAKAASANQSAANATSKAQTALDALLASVPASPAAAVLSARGDLASAQAEQASTSLAGQQSVSAAQVASITGPSAVAAAQAAATAADLAAGDIVSSKQIFLEQLRAGAAALPSAIRSARSALAVATASADATRRVGETLIATVEESGLNVSVRSAVAAVTAAAAIRGNARTALNVTQQRALLASGDLGAANRRTGISVPSDEVIFVTSAPVRVAAVTAKVGDAALGPLLTVSTSAVTIDSSLPLEEAPLVTVGMTVAVDEPNLGLSTTGTVSRVATSPGTDLVDGFHVYFSVDVDDAPPGLVGSSVRLTISVESSGGAVLTVPVSALSMTVDGTSRIQTSTAGVLTFVTVEPGLSAKGFVGVTPVDGALAAGDLVVVGFEQAVAPNG